VAPAIDPAPEATLRSLVAVLGASLEWGGLAMLGVRTDGRIVHVSPGFYLMAGLDPDASRDATFDGLVSALRGAGVVGDELASLLTTKDVSYDERGADRPLSDGRILEWSVARVDHELVVWTFRNVAVERHVSRALRDGEKWLRMFTAHADGIVFEVDSDARIVGLWSQDTSLFETWRDDFHNRTLLEAFGPVHGPFFDERVRSVRTTGRPANFEYTAERSGGKRVFAANAVLLPDEDGAPSTVTVLIRDVTERALLQQKLLQSERLASLGLLAAGVAHEVNNPLTYMLLNMQHVLRGLSGLSTTYQGQDLGRAIADYERCVAIAVEGATRVQEIVQDLRRFSRSDEHEPHRVIDVREVLSFTLAMIGAQVQKHARIVRSFEAVPNVLAGEGRLNQVFLNLIINAVQAIEEAGGSNHEIRLATLTDANGNAVVEVHDTGTGIPEAHLSKVFDPFFTTKAAGVGTGLGLAICHGITTSFGGQLTVQSRVGIGSVFRVVLPPTTQTPSQSPPSSRRI
jgi:signal transduction histidine kinase